jgi:hypothetical protein
MHQGEFEESWGGKTFARMWQEALQRAEDVYKNVGTRAAPAN